jgi:hypothetical protein
MTTESRWVDLAASFRRIRDEREPLKAEWYACEGREEFGIWLLCPSRRENEEVRADFSLIAARAIARLGLSPTPLPDPLQHDPQWRLYCRTEEELALLSGKKIDLSNAVPCLGDVDKDAVDPCTRTWLDLLRKESQAFRLSATGSTTSRARLWPA